MKKVFATFLLVATLVACASLVGPRNLKDQIVYSYGGIQVASATASALVDTGQMTKEEAAVYARELRMAKDKLDVAWAIYATKPLDAQDQLALANKFLLLVQQELNKRAEVKK